MSEIKQCIEFPTLMRYTEVLPENAEQILELLKKFGAVKVRRETLGDEEYFFTVDCEDYPDRYALPEGNILIVYDDEIKENYPIIVSKEFFNLQYISIPEQVKDLNLHYSKAFIKKRQTQIIDYYYGEHEEE